MCFFFLRSICWSWKSYNLNILTGNTTCVHRCTTWVLCHHLKLMKYKVDVCLLHLEYPHSWQHYEYSKTTVVYGSQLTLWRMHTISFQTNKHTLYHTMVSIFLSPNHKILTSKTSQNKQSPLDHHFKACNPMLSI